jgi:hypothetical protein
LARHRIYTTSFASVYPHYVAKAEKKGRTKAEVDEIIAWLTGYGPEALEAELAAGTDFETFFEKAPRMNPAREAITGSICGIRVETIEEPLMREIRYLDKLVDELARGKAMEKILGEREARRSPIAWASGIRSKQLVEVPGDGYGRISIEWEMDEPSLMVQPVADLLQDEQVGIRASRQIDQRIAGAVRQSRQEGLELLHPRLAAVATAPGPKTRRGHVRGHGVGPAEPAVHRLGEAGGDEGIHQRTVADGRDEPVPRPFDLAGMPLRSQPGIHQLIQAFALDGLPLSKPMSKFGLGHEAKISGRQALVSTEWRLVVATALRVGRKRKSEIPQDPATTVEWALVAVKDRPRCAGSILRARDPVADPERKLDAEILKAPGGHGMSNAKAGSPPSSGWSLPMSPPVGKVSTAGRGALGKQG